MNNPYRDKLLRTLQKFSSAQSAGSVFLDFVKLGALSVANSVSAKGSELWEERENQYINIMCKYKINERTLFTVMFKDLVEALEYELVTYNVLTDLLGELFHSLNLNRKSIDQFFTPQKTCNLMGALTLNAREKELSKHGFIALGEPCCGSGATVLGVASAMLERGLKYSTQLIVRATDIDIDCVYMCYLQLSLYGISAIVVHGDSSSHKEWSSWITPVYVTRWLGYR